MTEQVYDRMAHLEQINARLYAAYAGWRQAGKPCEGPTWHEVVSAHTELQEWNGAAFSPGR